MMTPHYYYWNNAHERLAISAGEFKFLVEKGLIRYALNMAQFQNLDVVPQSVVLSHQDRIFLDAADGSQIDDDSLPIAPKDFIRPTPEFLYISHPDLYSWGRWATDSESRDDAIRVKQFEDFNGRLLSLAVQGDCHDEDDFEASDLVSLALAIDTEGFLKNVRFTEEELARYVESDQLRLLNDPKAMTFPDFCEHITSLGEQRIQGPYKMERETGPSRFPLLACNAFVKRFDEAPTPSSVVHFMQSYAAERGEMKKLWRFDWDDKKEWIFLDPHDPKSHKTKQSLLRVIERILKK
jgi:hypothetical protein